MSAIAGKGSIGSRVVTSYELENAVSIVLSLKDKGFVTYGLAQLAKGHRVIVACNANTRTQEVTAALHEHKRCGRILDYSVNTVGKALFCNFTVPSRPPTEVDTKTEVTKSEDSFAFWFLVLVAGLSGAVYCGSSLYQLS